MRCALFTPFQSTITAQRIKKRVKRRLSIFNTHTYVENVFFKETYSGVYLKGSNSWMALNKDKNKKTVQHLKIDPKQKKNQLWVTQSNPKF